MVSYSRWRVGRLVKLGQFGQAVWYIVVLHTVLNTTPGDFFVKHAGRDFNPLLFSTQMGNGHSGAAGQVAVA